jgi:hypothetical protein
MWYLHYLREVELWLLPLFNVEIDPDPVHQSPIACPDGFDATEKPAVASFSIANPKTHLAGAARA